jgi:hypothetical protein
MFARKKRVPIEPPNSGPSVRLIITGVIKLSVYSRPAIPATLIISQQVTSRKNESSTVLVTYRENKCKMNLSYEQNQKMAAINVKCFNQQKTCKSKAIPVTGHRGL